MLKMNQGVLKSIVARIYVFQIKFHMSNHFNIFQYDLNALFLYPFVFDQLGVRLNGLSPLWFPRGAMWCSPSLSSRGGAPSPEGDAAFKPRSSRATTE